MTNNSENIKIDKFDNSNENGNKSHFRCCVCDNEEEDGCETFCVRCCRECHSSCNDGRYCKNCVNCENGGSASCE